MKWFLSIVLFGAICLSASAQKSLSPAQAKLATDAHQILVTYCGECHGQARNFSDEMLLEYKPLLNEEFVLPGNADKSDLYTKIVDGDMPPKKKKNPVPVDKLTILKKWIEAGAPDWNLAPKPNREFITNEEISRRVLEDLEKQRFRDRRFVRYYTLTHLYNVNNDAMGNYRTALAKLINSLSWEREITKPIPIDPEKTILRIDLRDFDWDLPIWAKIIEQYPYTVRHEYQSFKSVCRMAETDVPFVRADWFIANAALPPLYHEILELPKTDKELEDKLGVNVARNLRDSPGRRVWRSGFLESGVSKFNRIVERHKSPYGAYWKSYDFDSNKGRKNIFEDPLGFEHAGGEIIWNLPNGLQAYLLVDSKGKRIDKAPVEIVSNRGNPDPVIKNGLDCMSCHTAGMKEFKQRAGELHLAIPGIPYIKADVVLENHTLALYPNAKDVNTLVSKDKRTFEKAMLELGDVVGGKEPIALLTERFEEPIGPKLAAAEVGLDEETFVANLKEHGAPKGMNTLLAGGKIARETWEDSFSLAVSIAAKPRYFRWEFKTGGGVNSSPAIGSGGTVYVGSDDNKVYALEGKGGAKKWEFETGDDVTSSPAIGSDGTVYVGSIDKKLYAINPKSGVKLWEFETGGGSSSPAIGSDGTVYVGSNDKKLYAINGKTGVKLWEYITGGSVYSSPVIGADGTVYFGSTDKKVYALNGKRGVWKWEFKMGDEAGTPAIGSDGTVYVGSKDGKFHALDGKTGAIKWESVVGESGLGAEHSQPAIGSDGTVYVGSSDGKLYALDGKSGTKKWEYVTGLFVWASPAIGSDGTVYVGSSDKKIYALNGKTGVRQWEFETGDSSFGVVSSPAIGPDGTVYFGAGDKKVYAFKITSIGPAKSPWPMRGQNAQHTGRVMKIEE